MKYLLINEICQSMKNHLNKTQQKKLENTLEKVFDQYDISNAEVISAASDKSSNLKLLDLFLTSKQIEGCSPKTIKYYSNTLKLFLEDTDKSLGDISTNDIRCYLSAYQHRNNSGKVTIDNIRRILSSFFIWLENEDYILKSPVRRIHKIRTTKVVKETLTDENLEVLRDHCTHPRDIAIIDLLVSTGMRVGELHLLNISDVNFHDRECIVLGKGDKERKVYFDAKTKIRIYLNNFI